MFFLYLLKFVPVWLTFSRMESSQQFNSSVNKITATATLDAYELIYRCNMFSCTLLNVYQLGWNLLRTGRSWFRSDWSCARVGISRQLDSLFNTLVYPRLETTVATRSVDESGKLISFKQDFCKLNYKIVSCWVIEFRNQLIYTKKSTEMIFEEPLAVFLDIPRYTDREEQCNQKYTIYSQFECAQGRFCTRTYCKSYMYDDS